MLVLTGATIVATMTASRPARAHAFPAAEEPLVGSTISTAPKQVSIKFDAPIESLFAQLEVVDSGGNQQDSAGPAVDADQHTLSVPVKPLKPGDYTVKWSVVAQDGHRTEGSYTFTLAGGAQ
jgi:methionine-rich copper-binding protein CopC